jgi:cysteine desulfurase
LNESIYLDHAATTPVDPRVVDAMQPLWSEIFGNSASIHSFGRAAAKELESARGVTAAVLGCHPTELIFTGGGTESDNLAIRGLARAARQAGKGNHIVTTAVEHHAVGHTVAQLCAEYGFESTAVAVDAHGRVDPEAVQRSIRDDTVLISVMYANNEVGTVQPLSEISAIAKAHQIPIHTDAVQAPGKLPLRVDDLQVDLLSLSAHKFYGPKGVGLLYVRRGTPLVPAYTGGGHERGFRPGTVNVAGIVGQAVALELAEQERESETVRLETLRDRLINGMLERIPDIMLTGHPGYRLADSATFALKDCDGEALVMALDLAGIAASTGSACTTGDPEPSFVVEAMGLKPKWATGSLRLSLGRGTTEGQIEHVLDVMPDAVARTRRIKGLG